jgi:hypothetical protein
VDRGYKKKQQEEDEGFHYNSVVATLGLNLFQGLTLCVLPCRKAIG